MRSQGKVSWTSPSNIALVKYWGKKGKQIPLNPSLSMTLDEASTVTSVSYKRTGTPSLDFYFEGKRNDAFGVRIRQFIQSITDRHPWLNDLELIVESRNTFPHSSGIASSASSMSALALCMCTLREDIAGSFGSEEEFQREASFLARLGSGSASRSIYGSYALWGETPLVPESSDEYAVPVNHLVNDFFGGIRDAILVVSKEKKKVSSTAGHGLMNGHPYAGARLAQSLNHLQEMMKSLSQNDMETFISVTEREALSLHALMMSSSEAYMLMLPGTISLITKIRDFREQTGIPVCFTLDAGPNVHLIYHSMYGDRVLAFIENELLIHCEGRSWINDRCGTGPHLTEHEKDQ